MLWKYSLILLQLLREQKLDLNCNEYVYNYVLAILFISLRVWIKFDLFWKYAFHLMKTFAFIHFVRVFLYVKNTFFVIHVCMYFYDPHSSNFQKPKIKTLLSGNLRFELSFGGKLFNGVFYQ